ncbi:MAG: hypothetical protein QGF67_04605 [Lentisphaeria bacterium]|nr:hypothetical protein [Lentisphaeria bacterium]MDP7740696.1 hypothetical protein [Lentisphaeria bacterium]
MSVPASEIHAGHFAHDKVFGVLQHSRAVAGHDLFTGGCWDWETELRAFDIQFAVPVDVGATVQAFHADLTVRIVFIRLFDEYNAEFLSFQILQVHRLRHKTCCVAGYSPVAMVFGNSLECR